MGYFFDHARGVRVAPFFQLGAVDRLAAGSATPDRAHTAAVIDFVAADVAHVLLRCVIAKHLANEHTEEVDGLPALRRAAPRVITWRIK